MRWKPQPLFALLDRESPRQALVALGPRPPQAGLPAEIEVYAGAMHGWCPQDSTVYNEAQAERAWSRMLALFGRAL